MREEKETIAAISTPPGASGIGIVRLSGQDAIAIAEKIFISSKNKDIKEATHRFFHGFISCPDKHETIDEVLLSVAKAPNTYTREDTVEINCHGGLIPLRAVLSTVISAGARPAEPGEFTKRAFLNGRIDLTQAEAVIDTINAKTALSLAISHNQLKGVLSTKIKEMLAGAWEVLVGLESNIDFLEEDIPPFLTEEARRFLNALIEGANDLIATWQEGKILSAGATVSLVGRTNVGKSSLLNAILGEERCIVTDLPGTTRDVISVEIEIDGLAVSINDTAGLRRPENEAEEKGMAKARRAMSESDLVLFVLDSSEAIAPEDMEIYSSLNKDKTIIVLNKSDIGAKTTMAQIEAAFPLDRSISVSAKLGRGLTGLKERIRTELLSFKTENSEIILTNARHVEGLNRAKEFFLEAALAAEQNESEEFIASSVREAIGALEDVIGTRADEELLDRIFSKFCIGK